jgi:hypothetical protein
LRSGDSPAGQLQYPAVATSTAANTPQGSILRIAIREIIRLETVECRIGRF